MKSCSWPGCHNALPREWSRGRLTRMSAQKKIVFFDGVCNLCNATIDWLMRRDRRHVLLFASLQGATFQRMANQELAKLTEREDLSTVVYYDQGQVYLRSAAVLRAVAALSWAWRWVLLLLIIPAPARDLIYRFIARNRYRWFGKRETCRLPTPAEKERFLD
jgi:predicted DCC family thiol-disulfide oxidoreductase YuxK